MAVFDVFNGDADGLCALHQLRLAHPCRTATLITGPKREIRLLQRVDAVAGDQVCVFDISLDSNRADVHRLLQAGADVLYFDHHFPGEAFAHPGLTRHIDVAPDVCTSLLVDDWLQGAHRLWAVAAAFGDNLPVAARRRAAGLDAQHLAALQHLGECLNYNGYGERLEDLWLDPAELYMAMRPFADPFAFIEKSAEFRLLARGYAADRAHAERLRPLVEGDGIAVFRLPDAAWARRLSGILANELAVQFPARAHAVLTPDRAGHYTVSVRAPLLRPYGADQLCRNYPNGGGRSGAAGISGLPPDALDCFVQAFAQAFSPAGPH